MKGGKCLCSVMLSAVVVVLCWSIIIYFVVCWTCFFGIPGHVLSTNKPFLQLEARISFCLFGKLVGNALLVINFSSFSLFPLLFFWSDPKHFLYKIRFYFLHFLVFDFHIIGMDRLQIDGQDIKQVFYSNLNLTFSGGLHVLLVALP